MKARIGERRLLEEDFVLALELGERASEIALPLFHRGVTVRKKSDGSALTDADLAVERGVLEILAERRPGDAVLSEESGHSGASRRKWIVDPIDGTSFFAAHRDSWGTHIALEIDGEVVLGVITRPVAGVVWHAVRGHGAYRSELGSRALGDRLKVSDTSDLASARVMVWVRNETPLTEMLRAQGRWTELSLDGILQVASGDLDALVDYEGLPWDLAPAVRIVEEAGGHCDCRWCAVYSVARTGSALLWRRSDDRRPAGSRSLGR